MPKDHREELKKEWQQAFDNQFPELYDGLTFATRQVKDFISDLLDRTIPIAEVEELIKQIQGMKDEDIRKFKEYTDSKDGTSTYIYEALTKEKLNYIKTVYDEFISKLEGLRGK